jgi:hypothetical protein
MSVKWMSIPEYLILSGLLGLLGCAGASGPGEYPAAAGLVSAPAKSPVSDETPVTDTKTTRRGIREGAKKVTS